MSTFFVDSILNELKKKKIICPKSIKSLNLSMKL